MNSRRSFMRIAMSASAAPLFASSYASVPALPAKADGSDINKMHDIPLNLKAAHKGTIDIDQRILALSDPPDASRQFFSEARHIFENHPESLFSGLPELSEAAEKHGLHLLGGPMLGAVTHDSASVWIRTIRPAKVEVEAECATGRRRFGPVFSTAGSDLTAVVTVTGLTPATRHAYRLFIDEKCIPLPCETSILTTTVPDQAGRTTIAFGSCFHKTGLGNRALLNRIKSRNASALLILGDSAVDDRDGRTGLHCSDYLLRDLNPAWQELAANTPVYATWDDHDYFNNDKYGVPPGATEADRTALRRIWMNNWNNPASGFEDRNMGIFFHTRIGPCDLIMLDTRSMRTRPGEPDSFLGAEQMRWLEQTLKTCKGDFVFLTSGTMWSDNISNGKDSWGIWDIPGRERIFSLIEKLRLPVILLSGDRHGARVINIPRPSGYKFREIEAASLGAHPGPAAYGKSKENQPFGMTGKTLYGECVIDTSLTDPTAKIQIIDIEGTAHWQRTFTRSELTPPKS